MTLKELDRSLLSAHEKVRLDEAYAINLVDLYYTAYLLTLPHNTTEAYFFLTNAYVYALDNDHQKVDEIEGILRNANRI